MSDFQDAIGDSLNLCDPNHDNAAVVLAMPEMQAIRAALRLLHAIGDAMCEDTLSDLPESVVAWVLENP